MKIIFYDYFNAADAIRAFFCFKQYEKMYYFNISRLAKFLLISLGLNKQVSLFDFRLSEIKNDLGESYFPKIFGKDLIGVCDDIQKNILDVNTFVDSFAKIFKPNSSEKIKIFFRKLAGKEMKDVVVFMNVISWYCKNSQKASAKVVEFAIEKTLFFNSLKEFAIKECNLTVVSHISFRKILGYCYFFVGNVHVSSVTCLKSIVNLTKKRDAPNKEPLVSSLYTLRGLNFNLTARNDFPWLLLSDIERKQALIYFDRKDMPLTEDMATMLKEQGVNCMAVSDKATTSKNVAVYQPTPRVAKMIIGLTFKALSLVAREMLRRRFISIIFFPAIMHFIRSFAQAYDFYMINGIKVDVDFVDFDPYRIARRLALANAGGVSVSHQLSNWPISNVILGSSADAYFVFGPYYHSKLLASGTCNEAVIVSGFLTDYSFSQVKEKSAKLRKKLLDNGAEFIVCYFDENSSDRRMSIIPNGRSRLIYKYLLNWVLNDKTIGLICSPKRPRTLQTRLSEISGLMQQAKDTGRCVFMGGEYMAENYPTEIGQAADFAISLLIGGTTSLENFLSGVRVIYLDLEGLHSYPEYCKKDLLVFNDLDKLIMAIKDYRLNPKVNDDLGNGSLVPGLKEKDPFCDGRSAERMGQYISWLLNGFSKGKTRKQVMDYANSRYVDAWGKEKVISGVN